jgi:hypothetical protein
MAHPADGKCRLVLFPSHGLQTNHCRAVNELKPHGFWRVKNTVAFSRISLSSLRMPPLTHASMCCRSRVSRAEADHSLGRGSSSFDTTSEPLYAVIHLFSVDMPTPRSSATCLRVSPLVSAIRTASWRNSSVRFNPIVYLLCCNKCYQRRGIKPRQVQNVYLRPNAGFGPPVLTGIPIAFTFGLDSCAVHCPLSHMLCMCCRAMNGTVVCLQTMKGDEEVQWPLGPTIRQTHVQCPLAPLGRLLCNRLPGSGRHKVVKSGAAQSNPTKRSKLWTNPVV